MPHQCIYCSKVFPDASTLVNGCECGSRVFLFKRNGDAKPDAAPAQPQPQKAVQPIIEKEDAAAKEIIENISSEEPEVVVGGEAPDVLLDAQPIENITAIEKGVYSVDLDSLFSARQTVIRDHFGTYFIKYGAPLGPR